MLKKGSYTWQVTLTGQLGVDSTPFICLPWILLQGQKQNVNFVKKFELVSLLQFYFWWLIFQIDCVHHATQWPANEGKQGKHKYVFHVYQLSVRCSENRRSEHIRGISFVIWGQTPFLSSSADISGQMCWRMAGGDSTAGTAETATQWHNIRLCSVFSQQVEKWNRLFCRRTIGAQWGQLKQRDKFCLFYIFYC